MDGVVTFLIVAALVFGLFLALTVFARELYNYVRARARKATAARPSPAKPGRTDERHAGAAGAHGDSALAHDALPAGYVAGAAAHAAADTSGSSGAGESSSGSTGEAGGGYESSSSGGDGGGDYGGGGDFGGGGGGGGWS